jgi:hypothetical protein
MLFHAHEVALLAAVALPVISIAGLNALLVLAGERGTLLLPSGMRFESIGTRVTIVREVSAQRVDTASAAANDTMLELQAA